MNTIDRSTSEVVPTNTDNEERKDKAEDPIIPEEILEGLPEEDRGRIQGIIRQTMVSAVMGNKNPIAEKITSEHITKIIENSDNQDKRDRDERRSEKNYEIIFLLIGLVFLGFLIVFLKDDKELLYKIIIAILSFIGGFGIGKTSKRKHMDD